MVNSFLPVNMAFDISGLVLLLLSLVPMALRSRYVRNRQICFSSTVLHAAALFVKLIGGIAVLIRQEAGLQGYRLAAFLLDLVSIGLLIYCILSDEDGHVYLIKRTRPLPVPMILWSILPTLAAVLIEQILPGLSLLGFSYALSLHVVWLFVRSHETEAQIKREQELGVAKGRLLVEQLRPHFLFNMLMMIEVLCSLDPDRAAKAIVHFSDYLRANMDSLSNPEPVPFTRELETIETYLALEKADPDRVFKVEYDCDFTDFRLPMLSIRPLVENAVRHEVLRSGDREGLIRISTRPLGRYVQICVQDNGSGFGSGEPGPHHRDIGLDHVRKRIEELGGGSMQISTSEEGTRVTVLLPVSSTERHVRADAPLV